MRTILNLKDELKDELKMITQAKNRFHAVSLALEGEIIWALQ